MTEIEKLLEPIAGKNPCGEDIWLAEGRSLLQQPLEQAWRNSEQPKWEDVRETALEQLQRSRDLRTAVVFCLALLGTDGLPGFRDGVALIRGLLEKFWDHIYPVLPGAAGDQIRSNTKRENQIWELTGGPLRVLTARRPCRSIKCKCVECECV